MSNIPSPETRTAISSKLTTLIQTIESDPAFDRSSPSGLFHMWDFAKRTEYMLSEVDNIRQPGYEFRLPGQIKISKSFFFFFFDLSSPPFFPFDLDPVVLVYYTHTHTHTYVDFQWFYERCVCMYVCLCVCVCDIWGFDDDCVHDAYCCLCIRKINSRKRRCRRTATLQRRPHALHHPRPARLRPAHDARNDGHGGPRFARDPGRVKGRRRCL